MAPRAAASSSSTTAPATADTGASKRRAETGQGLSYAAACLLYDLHGVAHDVKVSEGKGVAAVAAARTLGPRASVTHMALVATTLRLRHFFGDELEQLPDVGSVGGSDTGGGHDDDDLDGARDGAMALMGGKDARHIGDGDRWAEDANSSLSLLLPRAMVALLRRKGPDGRVQPRQLHTARRDVERVHAVSIDGTAAPAVRATDRLGERPA